MKTTTQGADSLFPEGKTHTHTHIYTQTHTKKVRFSHAVEYYSAIRRNELFIFKNIDESQR